MPRYTITLYMQRQTIEVDAADEDAALEQALEAIEPAVDTYDIEEVDAALTGLSTDA